MKLSLLFRTYGYTFEISFGCLRFKKGLSIFKVLLPIVSILVEQQCYEYTF